MELNNLPVAGHNELAVSAQAAGAMAEIQSAYVMAYHKPRDTDRARIRILNECKRPRFAEGAKYRRPVGKDKYGKQIFAEGVSIRGAEALQRCFGNVLVRSDTLYDDDRVRKISVTVIDLESNTIQTLSGMIEKTVERKYAQDREILSERETSTGGKVFILKALPHEIDLKEGALRFARALDGA